MVLCEVLQRGTKRYVNLAKLVGPRQGQAEPPANYPANNPAKPPVASKPQNPKTPKPLLLNLKNK